MNYKVEGMAAIPLAEQFAVAQAARSFGFHPIDILGGNVNPYTVEGVARAQRARGIASVTPVSVKVVQPKNWPIVLGSALV